MQSNQPFQQDSVLDGALIGAAAGAGMMYGVTKAAPAINSWNKQDTKKNAREYTKQLKSESSRSEALAAKTQQGQLAQSVSTNPNQTAAQHKAGIMAPDKLKEVSTALSNMEASKEMKKAQGDLKFNRTVDKYSNRVTNGSARTRAAMYGGSVIAGAIGGAMIDRGN